MPEWWIERGIGETRAALVDHGRIVEARILRDGVLAAGTILTARLKRTGRNAIAVADDVEYLLPSGSGRATEGAAVQVEVVREALTGSEGWKRPLGRISDRPPCPAPAFEGRALLYPRESPLLDEAGWRELVDEARSGIIGFPGGGLRVSLTPAMTLIDVDGTLSPQELAIAGAGAAALAIRRHGIAGSIGIDLPTLDSKAARQSAGEAIDALLPKPFERTAVNGFGFVQLVRPRRHASSFELASDRPRFEALDLVRSVSRETGTIRLVAHPRLVAELERNADWLRQLERVVGGSVTLRPDPSLAMSAGYAEQA
ncbi:ribonuclease [Sphingomonas xanthus]|uniref:Ribonuclease n=1 Tax=Sphingomonas xanthus TaxID=2594473 RepID=A0A516IR54_9SPHN|nr:ribonuclease [Sphingomonas xanthus]QDP19386.1 ribonuclease [Sphingomonas xanthus]